MSMALSRCLRYSSIMERLLSTSSCEAQGTHLNRSTDLWSTHEHSVHPWEKNNNNRSISYLWCLGLTETIFLFEDLGVFLQILLNELWISKCKVGLELTLLDRDMRVTLLLTPSHLYLLLSQERGRTGPPQQLAETLFVVLLQQTALECPQPKGVVHLNYEEKKYQFIQRHLICIFSMQWLWQL